MEIHLEIFFARITGGEIIYIKKVVDISTEESNPDNIVQRALNYNPIPGISDISELLIHSTSWRYENSGRLVLTYLVYSEKLNVTQANIEIIPLENLKVALSGNSKTPRPVIIEEKDIISHGFRHLGFLVKNDPVIRQAFSANLTSLKALEDLPGAVAGLVS